MNGWQSFFAAQVGASAALTPCDYHFAIDRAE
jgi:hypothetical protein